MKKDRKKFIKKIAAFTAAFVIAASSYAVYIPAADAVKLSAPTEDITAGEFVVNPLSVNSTSGGGIKC